MTVNNANLYEHNYLEGHLIARSPVGPMISADTGFSPG